MNKSKIEWCTHTWNPIVGCTHGCDYCYARNMGKRIYECHVGRNYKIHKSEVGCQVPPCEKCRDFVPHFHPERLDGPGKVKKPGRVFVCSMGDFYDPAVDREWQTDIRRVIRESPQHQFLILTKQPQLHIRQFINCADKYDLCYPNLWQGVSVTGPDDLWRIDELIKRVPARRFVSFEPLLGCISKLDIIDRLAYIDWVIIGAQTNPTVNPDLASVNNIINMCIMKRMPFFLKDNLNREKIQQYPDGLILPWEKGKDK